MAATKDRLKKDLAAAMRAKDEAAKTTIRMLLAAITVEEVAGSQARKLSDAEEVAVATKEANRRRDAAQVYAEAGRQDLAEKELSEADLISRYVPEPLTAEELAYLVDAEVAALGEPPRQAHMGQLMKTVTTKAAGRAQGKDIAALVRSRLA